VQQNVDFTANLETPSSRQRLPRLTRGRLIGFAGALLMVSAYFGTVVWIGSDLAADMKAGTREVTAGMMVPDLEG
jgi:hypothetical protein